MSLIPQIDPASVRVELRKFGTWRWLWAVHATYTDEPDQEEEGYALREGFYDCGTAFTRRAALRKATDIAHGWAQPSEVLMFGLDPVDEWGDVRQPWPDA